MIWTDDYRPKNRMPSPPPTLEEQWAEFKAHCLVLLLFLAFTAGLMIGSLR